jgi:hypothetical protein
MRMLMSRTSLKALQFLSLAIGFSLTFAPAAYSAAAQTTNAARTLPRLQKESRTFKGYGRSEIGLPTIFWIMLRRMECPPAEA